MSEHSTEGSGTDIERDLPSEEERNDLAVAEEVDGRARTPEEVGEDVGRDGADDGPPDTVAPGGIA